MGGGVSPKNRREGQRSHDTGGQAGRLTRATGAAERIF